MKNVTLFGVKLNSIPSFEDFAGQHYAYDEDENIVWAPTEMNDFAAFMKKHYAQDSEARSNFREGAEEWIEACK